MDELQRAVAQFYPASGGINEGGFSQPPTPTPPPDNSGLGLIPGAQSEGDSDKEVFFTPRQSVSSASSSSTSTPNIESCSPNKGQNQEQDSFTYIQPGSEEHEAMKESFIRIARGKLEEWEASALIDGLISKKPNEELSQALNLELIQTKEEMEMKLKEFLELDWHKLKKVPAGDSYARFLDLVREHSRKTGLE